MEEHVTVAGRRMTLSQLTLYSVRDRNASTVLHEWGYPEEQLLPKGSW